MRVIVAVVNPARSVNAVVIKTVNAVRIAKNAKRNANVAVKKNVNVRKIATNAKRVSKSVDLM